MDEYPQMPVLLIATVTHPSGRSSPLPFLTLSRLGVDSSTHSLCSGLVKTPMLGLEMVSTVVVVVVDILTVDQCTTEEERERESIEEEDESVQGNCGRSSYPTVEGLEGYGIPRETVLIELLAHQSKKQQSNAMYAWKRSCGSSPQQPVSGEEGQSKGEEVV